VANHGVLEWDRAVPLRDGPVDVLAVGELLVDLISADYAEDFEAAVYHRYFGGSPANIAMNLNRLGARPQVASAVGDDGLGRYLLDRLRHAGLKTDLVDTVDEATSMVLLNKSRNSPVPIFYRGADGQLPWNEKLVQALLKSKILHFSCWPISMMPARGTIERLIRIAKDHRIRIGFDPNYHPGIWQKGEDGVAYVKSIVGQADFVKPSDDDAERLFGQDTPENQIRKFLDLGARLVILTLGRKGALASNGKEIVAFPTLADRVEDTTGAGDAFWSGFYAALTKGYAIRDSLTLGFAASAYKLKFTGAVADLPRLETLKEIYGR
jgi:fructokinase